MRERAEEVLRRQEQQRRQRRDRKRQRQSVRRAIRNTKPPVSAAQNDDQGEERAQAVDAEHRAGDHRQQVRRRRVMRHFAHRAVERSIVNEMAVLLDVIDEQEVMRQIGPAARRQERWPRQAQEHRDQEDHDAEPGDQIAGVRMAGAPLTGGEGRVNTAAPPAAAIG